MAHSPHRESVWNLEQSIRADSNTYSDLIPLRNCNLVKSTAGEGIFCDVQQVSLDHVLVQDEPSLIDTAYHECCQLSDQQTSFYEELPEGHIRLLQLLRCEGSEAHCSITTLSTDHCPKYTALSYEWGGSPRKVEVKINGHHRLIGENLWDFLQETYSGRDRQDFRVEQYLWIDALCIDQRNLKERNYQVSIMATIYSQASFVIAWLGKSGSGSDQAMNALARGESYPPESAKGSSIWSRTWHAIQQIADLCDRSYWSRLWIFQEISFAQEVILMCGSAQAPWKPLRDLLSTGLTPNSSESAYSDSFEYETIRKSPAVCIAQWTSRSKDIQPPCLLDGVVQARLLRCRDPRDRVYALKALYPRGSQGIAVDYGRPLPLFLNDILRSHHTEVEAPDSLETVRVQCSDIETLWRQHPTTAGIFCLVEDHPGDMLSTKAMDKHPLTVPNTPISLRWAMHYNHTAIAHMIITSPVFEVMTKLADAVHDGDLGTISIILQANASLKATGRPSVLRDFVGNLYEHQGVCVTYQTLLQDAATASQHEVVKMLLSSDYGCSATFETVSSPAAVSAGNIATVLALLQKGADASAGLLAACQLPSIDLLELLLQHIARHGARPVLKTSILHDAIRLGNTAAVRILVTAGANMDEIVVGSGDQYLNALTVAASAGNIDILDLLLDAGAEKDAVDSDGNHMLTRTLCSEHMLHLQSLNVDKISASRFHSSYGRSGAGLALSGRGVDIWSEANGQMIAWAAEMTRSSYKLVNFLLQHKVQGGLLPRLLNAALAAAAKHGVVKTIQLLIDAGADVNAQSGRLGLPLAQSLFSYGARGDELSAVRLLLSKGADPNARCPAHGHRSIIAIAADCAPENIIRGLRDVGANLNSSPTTCEEVLLGAARQGYDDLLRLLLYEAGSIPADLLCQVAHTCTAATLKDVLRVSTDRDREGLYRKAGCPASKARRSNALEAAIRGGKAANVRLLLDAGFTSPHTALRISAHTGQLEIVEQLLSRGIERDAELTYQIDRWMGQFVETEIFCKTAMEAAIDNEHELVADRLRSYGFLHQVREQEPIFPHTWHEVDDKFAFSGSWAEDFTYPAVSTRLLSWGSRIGAQMTLPSPYLML